MLGLLACAGFAFPLQMALILSFGWILFLRRTLPEVDFDLVGGIIAVIALAGIVVGVHLTARWLSKATPDQNGRRRTAWPLGRSLAVVGLVVIMFASGTAATGVVHQTGWLISAPEPLLGYNSIRESSYISQSKNNLKNIVLGIYNYADTHDQQLPPGGLYHSDGRGRHGWATLILPYIDEPILYDQLDLSKDWDSGENRRLLQESIGTYRTPLTFGPADVADYFSHYAANARVMGADRQLRLQEITDGTSNTLLIGEVTQNLQPWASPHNFRDPTLGLGTHPWGFDGPWERDICQFAMADGSAREINEDIDPEVLRRLALPNDGEEVGDY
ncbi:DUF1559 family PulG-like putative transporter [Stratiformator vulcanicus]|uniref:DUF1559 family PulG-like putative transporter n=1 Tax=Stratiformator vulcanicus TaxID=2527980 RepID=UPI002877432F|nr:DUF1559 domain-containing protein [Stratiformator vulcanicus]